MRPVRGSHSRSAHRAPRRDDAGGRSGVADPPARADEAPQPDGAATVGAVAGAGGSVEAAGWTGADRPVEPGELVGVGGSVEGDGETKTGGSAETGELAQIDGPVEASGLAGVGRPAESSGSVEVGESVESGGPVEAGESSGAGEVKSDGPEGKAGATPVVETTVLHDIVVLLLKIAVIILAFILVFTFLFGFFRTESADMSPNVDNGDLVMYYRLDKNYAASDLVVLAYQGEDQIRRVVATAGDCVNIDADGLKVNGALQQEPKIPRDQVTQPYADGIRFTGQCPSGEPGVGVGEGEIFVLADARDNGVDSRVYGPVKVADTLGKVNMLLRRRQF